MATTFMRRAFATAAAGAIATVVAPLALSVVPGSVALAASAPPKMDETTSAPEQGGALFSVSGNISAVFDQEITGNDGSSTSKTCQDTSGTNQCSFVLYEVNADGSRGLRLPGATSFDTSGNPVTGIQDTVIFNPDFSLADGGSYECVVQVFGVDSNSKKVPAMVTNLDYKIFISSALPSKLSAPATATTGNNTEFPLSGYAPPGQTVSVDVESDDPSGKLDATGSVVVDPCSAISCPWTIKVDISGSSYSSPTNNVNWTANAVDANGSPSSPTDVNAKSQTPPATFNIDYSPPAMPTSFTATITNDSQAHTSVVTVSAQDSDTDTKSYLVTITDAAKGQVQQSFPAQGTNLPSTQVDVSSLNDGTVHVLVQAADAVGNVSDECDNNPPPVQKCTSKDLPKAAGFAPSLTTSVLTSDGGDTTFANAESGGAVQSPTKVTVGFTQKIKESWTDCCPQPPAAGPQTHHSSLAICTPNLNCVASGGTPTVASDNSSITFPIATKLPDGTYVVRITTYSQSNCPDRTPQNAASYSGCPTAGQYSDFVRIPGTGTPATPFQFRVNSTPPTVTIDSVTNPITASNEKSVSASGTVAASASTVQVLYTSSGKSPTKLLVNASITPPPSGSSTATWGAGPSDLSTFPDGSVTVKVTAKSASGLSATATKTVTMQAHLTTLSETTDHGKVTAGHAIHIAGHLSDEDGNPIANATISVRPKFTTGKLGHAAAAVTNSAGAYSATFVPKFTARYIATFAGSPEHDGATRNTAKTSVRAAVSLSGQASQSTPVTVTGHVSPSKHGKLVTLFKKTSSGWVVAGKARLSGRSKFTAKLTLTPGKNKLYASIGKTKGNLAGKSRVLTITVH